MNLHEILIASFQVAGILVMVVIMCLALVVLWGCIEYVIDNRKKRKHYKSNYSYRRNGKYRG